MMNEQVRPQDQEREDALVHFVEVLEGLENHGLSVDERKAIEKAFDLIERGKEVSATAAEKANFALGIRLVGALDRIGYFGTPHEPFDYDSARSMAYRSSASSIPVDYGATLLLTILSDLRNKELRTTMREELTKLIQDIGESRGKTFLLSSKEFAVMLRSQARVHALALWLLFKEPKPPANEGNVGK